MDVMLVLTSFMISPFSFIKTRMHGYSGPTSPIGFASVLGFIPKKAAMIIGVTTGFVVFYGAWGYLSLHRRGFLEVAYFWWMRGIIMIVFLIYDNSF